MVRTRTRDYGEKFGKVVLKDYPPGNEKWFAKDRQRVLDHKYGRTGGCKTPDCKQCLFSYVLALARLKEGNPNLRPSPYTTGWW